MKDNKKVILKTLVGSHAHGLAGPDSDYDLRSVYTIPTAEIISIGYNYKGTHWVEGEGIDQTGWELGHFLLLATKCNPTIMECFVAPCVVEVNVGNGVIETQYHSTPLNTIGSDLRALFPYLWTPQQAFDAHVGYGLNQRRKLLDNHLGRWHKYGTAYLRTLVNLIDLLQTRYFSLVVQPGEIKEFILAVRDKKKTPGEIVDKAEQLTALARIELNKYLSGEKKQEQDLDEVNNFLIEVRRRSLNEE